MSDERTPHRPPEPPQRATAPPVRLGGYLAPSLTPLHLVNASRSTRT